MPPRSEMICEGRFEVTGDQLNLADTMIELYLYFVKKGVAMVPRILVKSSENEPVRL